MRVAFAAVLLGACGGEVSDDADAADATSKSDVYVEHDAVTDESPKAEASTDACSDACCLKGGTICGNWPDASGCAACCADAWGTIPKTVDFVCEWTD